MSGKYAFKPVKRFTFPAPIPYFLTEDELPKNQRVLVFLPHSDDGRYFGCSLHLMNRDNQIEIIIVSPGHFGVDGDQSQEEKIEIRWNEAVNWAEKLGFNKSDLFAFRADKTYYEQRINRDEQERMHQLIKKEKPTMVFIPHISDTAQAINYHTRQMVIKSLVHWLANYQDKRRIRKPTVLVAEYTTNHVPLLPPSDKNCIVVFTDPQIANIKHEANCAHKTQERSYFGIIAKAVEALHAIAEADTFLYFNRRKHYTGFVAQMKVDPRTSRGEHFGVTKIFVDEEAKRIVEERVEFPLSRSDEKLWLKGRY